MLETSGEWSKGYAEPAGHFPYERKIMKRHNHLVMFKVNRAAPEDGGQVISLEPIHELTGVQLHEGDEFCTGLLNIDIWENNGAS